MKIRCKENKKDANNYKIFSKQNKNKKKEENNKIFNTKIMKTSKTTKSPVGKRLSKTEAKAIVGGKSVKGRISKSKLQSNQGVG